MENENVDVVLTGLEGMDLSDLSLYEINILSSQLNAVDITDDNKNRIAELKQKIGTKLQTLEENAKFNENNAEEFFDKGVDDMTPSDLYELRIGLVKGNSDKVKDLDAIIVKKAQAYINGDSVILKSDDKYVLQDLLRTVAEVSKDEDLKNNAQEVKSSIDAEIKAFEEYHGIEETQLVDVETVKVNLEVLNKMPSDEQLFTKEGAKYEAISPTELRDVKVILNKYNDESILEISVLAGALQCEDLDESDRKKLENWAVKKVQKIKTSELVEPQKIANFGVLLENLDKNESNKKTVEKGKKVFEEAKAQYEAKLPLVNKDLEEINTILDRIVFTGELKTFGREKFKGKDDDEMKALFREQVRQETVMFLANTTKGEITEEAFREEYATSLQLGILKMHASEGVLKGTINRDNAKEEFEKQFKNIIDSDKKIEIS